MIYNDFGFYKLDGIIFKSNYLFPNQLFINHPLFELIIHIDTVASITNNVLRENVVSKNKKK